MQRDGSPVGSAAPFEIFRPRRKRDWNALLDRLGGSSQLDRCLDVARRAGARTAIVEHRYVDADYRSEYSTYWSMKFHHVDGFARRVHFFGDDIADDAVHAIPDTADYIGYIVIRPLDEGVVGRTMLRPPNDLLKKNPVLADCTDSVSVFGTPFSVRGVPFCTQDAEYLRCAHVAAWMCHYSAHLRGLIGRQLTTELAAYAPAEVSDGRRLPSDGLNDQQIQAVFTRAGLPAIRYTIADIPTVIGVDQHPRVDPTTGRARPRTKAEQDRATITTICRYLRSGFPVLVSTERHVFALVGYTERSPGGHRHINFIAADDQVGPYELINPRLTNPKLGAWQAITIPLLPRVLLAGESAETDAATTLTTLRHLALDDLPIPGDWATIARGLDSGRYRLQTLLLLARDYKRNLPLQGRANETVERLRLAQQSRWIWIVEAHDEKQRLAGEPSVLAEFIYDYTSSDRPAPHRLAVSHQGSLTTFDPDTREPRRFSPLQEGPWVSHLRLHAASRP